MKFNFNKILNEKNALKAFSRGTKDNNVLTDLNSKLLLGLNFAKSQTFPQVAIQKKSVSKINSSLTWKLLSNSSSQKSDVNSYLQKPLLELGLSESQFYRRSYVRRKKAFLVYRQGLKGSLRPISVRSRFLKFRQNYLKKSSLVNKLYFLNLHKNNSLIFQKPKISSVSSKIYTIFDKKTRSISTHFNTRFLAISKDQLYLSISKKLKKGVENFIKKQKVKIIKKEVEKVTSHSKGLDINLKLAMEISKKMSLAKKSTANSLTLKDSSSFDEICSRRELLEKYIKLNEKNKEKIKKTIETANIEFVKSDLLKIRTEQLSKYKSNSRFAKSKRSKKYNKGKSKTFIRSNSKPIVEIYRRLQRKTFPKYSKSSVEKSKSDRKFDFKLKLPFKSKNFKV